MVGGAVSPVITVVPGANATPRNASLDAAVASVLTVPDIVAPGAAESTIFDRVPEVPAEPLPVA